MYRKSASNVQRIGFKCTSLGQSVHLRPGRGSAIGREISKTGRERCNSGLVESDWPQMYRELASNVQRIGLKCTENRPQMYGIGLKCTYRESASNVQIGLKCTNQPQMYSYLSIYLSALLKSVHLRPILAKLIDR